MNTQIRDVHNMYHVFFYPICLILDRVRSIAVLNMFSICLGSLHQRDYNLFGY